MLSVSHLGNSGWHSRLRAIANRDRRKPTTLREVSDTMGRPILVGIVAAGIYLPTVAFAQDIPENSEPEPPSDFERALRNPLPEPEPKTPLEVLQRGDIPHRGNSKVPDGPTIRTGPDTGVSPTFDPPGAVFEYEFDDAD